MPTTGKKWTVQQRLKFRRTLRRKRLAKNQLSQQPVNEANVVDTDTLGPLTSHISEAYNREYDAKRIEELREHIHRLEVEVSVYHRLILAAVKTGDTSASIHRY